VITIDVIVRTHNRKAMLGPAVSSFLEVDRTGIAARLLVVDNASSDGTDALLEELAARHGDLLVALHEPRPGGQHALNRGIAAARAEVVAFFDDDERIEPDWLQVIAREFADPQTDYIAGPVRPIGECPMPHWLPQGFGGVLGVIDSGAERRSFGPGFAAMLTQGNCAVRRRVFEACGPYPDALPTAEDRWLNQWLEANRQQGFYCPDLVVGHVMQQDRITKDYFRRWAAREGRDLAVCDRMGARPVPFSQPWYWRQLCEHAFCLLNPFADQARRFRAELELRVALAYLRTLSRLRAGGEGGPSPA
jgi:glycosyltransferase involved in cell wall biosynthesis